MGIVVRNFARLHHASGDATLPATVAGILGVTPDEAVDLLTRVLADEDDRVTG